MYNHSVHLHNPNAFIENDRALEQTIGLIYNVLHVVGYRSELE